MTTRPVIARRKKNLSPLDFTGVIEQDLSRYQMTSGPFKPHNLITA
jgi:hypothetical protein